MIYTHAELTTLLGRIVEECEENGTSNIYENSEGNPYRADFPTPMGELLGEARLVIGGFEVEEVCAQ